MSATVSPDFKSFVAETLRLQAATDAKQQRRSEAARKLIAARKLERQVRKAEHVHA